MIGISMVMCGGIVFPCQDVIPGVEREMNKIRGWLAMLEARSHDNGEHELNALKVRQKYDQLETSLNVFKVSIIHRIITSVLCLYGATTSLQW